MGQNGSRPHPAVELAGPAEQQHLAWLARSFGRRDYSPLSTADLRKLLDTGEMVSNYPGTHLFREGEPAVAVYLIESGEAEMYRGDGAGRRVVARVGPGSVLGDLAMFEGIGYFASAQAVTRVRALRLDRDRLLPQLTRYPAIGIRWLVAGLRHLEGTQRRVIDLMHKTVLGQVADLLAEEADSRGEVHLSQSTLATLLGVSRQSVNEALGRLRDQGAVETGYRNIRVLDRERLKRISEA